MLGTGLRDRTEGLESIELDDDRTENAGDFASPSPEECLHYAPRNHRGLQNRIATLAQWIARYRPALLVVDVSVEVAMLARLAGVRTIYVRLAGNRDDRAHRQAFLSAHKLLAPFHADLDETSTPDWVRNKTVYAPGITQTLSGVQIDETRILVVSGSGGRRLGCRRATHGSGIAATIKLARHRSGATTRHQSGQFGVLRLGRGCRSANRRGGDSHRSRRRWHRHVRHSRKPPIHLPAAGAPL